MRIGSLLAAMGAALALGALSPASAQAPEPYGAPVRLAQAEAMLDAAEAEARKNNWYVAIAVVDGGGHLVAFRRMDGVGTAVTDIALGKARTAAAFRQSSKNIEGWAKATSAVLAIPGVMPIQGGLPVEIGGQIVGGIGVSGVASEDDERIAAAGLAALKK